MVRIPLDTYHGNLVDHMQCERTFHATLEIRSLRTDEEAGMENNTAVVSLSSIEGHIKPALSFVEFFEHAATA